MNNLVGITEKGDPSIDHNWIKKLNQVNMAIIITKDVNSFIQENLLKNKNKCILHANITGYGGSIMEPKIPTIEDSYKNLQNLISKGFPLEQIVLRIDPVIPTKEGLLKMKQVLLHIGQPLNIKRVRFSFLAMYNHVKTRFSYKKVPIPYNFKPGYKMVISTLRLISKYEHLFDFECCVENIPGYKLGCISQKDVNILRKNIVLTNSYKQRKECVCPSNKYELLSNPYRCPYQCLYCYWKDKVKSYFSL